MKVTETAIYSLLPRADQRLYRLAAPSGTRTQFESILDQVLRWQNLDYTPSDPEFVESDLTHVLGLLQLVNELELQQPKISQSINLSAVRGMIIVHDASEMYVGDGLAFCSDDQKEYNGRRKELEPRTAYRWLRYVHAEKRSFVEGLYQRYNAREKLLAEQRVFDRNAWFVKFLDMFIGNETGFTHIFNSAIISEAYPNAERENMIGHALRSNNKILEMGAKFFTCDNDQVMQTIINDLVIRDINNRRLAGYPQFALAAESQWRQKTQSAVTVS